MKKEEAKEHYEISTSNKWDFDKFIDEVYSDFDELKKKMIAYMADAELLIEQDRGNAHSLEVMIKRGEMPDLWYELTGTEKPVLITHKHVPTQLFSDKDDDTPIGANPFMSGGD